MFCYNLKHSVLQNDYRDSFNKEKNSNDSSKILFEYRFKFSACSRKKMITCSSFHLRYVIHEQFWTSIINIRKGNKFFFRVSPAHAIPYHISAEQSFAKKPFHFRIVYL